MWHTGGTGSAHAAPVENRHCSSAAHGVSAWCRPGAPARHTLGTPAGPLVHARAQVATGVCLPREEDATMPMRRPSNTTALPPSPAEQRDQPPSSPRHPASRAKSAQTRHPALRSTQSEVTPADMPHNSKRAVTGTRRQDRRSEPETAPPRTPPLSARQRQGRQDARHRASARVQRVAVDPRARASGPAVSQSARGGTMHRDDLTLAELGERQVRHLEGGTVERCGERRTSGGSHENR